jgi:hypothetical protein
MARRPNHLANVTGAVDGLLEAVTGLVSAVRTTIEAGRRTGVAAGEVKAVATEKGKKLQKSLKSYWANLKGKAREERIRKMLAGRGLVPKAARGDAKPRRAPAKRGGRPAGRRRSAR